MGGYDVKKNEACFRAAWKNVVALCVFLWEEDGLTEKEIIGHAEGHGQGIASNHADPLHWFPKHGESMDTFRATVKKALEGDKKASLFPITNTLSCSNRCLFSISQCRGSACQSKEGRLF